MPSTLLKRTSLLPSNVQSPSTDFFTVSDTPKEAAAAAAAFFSEQHLQTVLPVLRGSSSSHPRLHSLWPTLFALLLPGFKAVKVQLSSVRLVMPTEAYSPLQLVVTSGGLIDMYAVPKDVELIPWSCTVEAALTWLFRPETVVSLWFVAGPERCR